MSPAATVTGKSDTSSTMYSTGVNYPLPASIKEHARLEEQSVCLADLMGRTYHAPLPAAPTLLLDIGCGTGVVTTYLGNTFPTANVYGIDLSPVPQIHHPPPNVKYIQGDIHELSSLDPRIVQGAADLSFGRLLVCGIRDWLSCIVAMKNLVKPGAWVELQDLNNRLFDSDNKRVDVNMEWMRVLRASLESKGLDPDAGINARKYMEKAGLVDIQSWEYKWTVGPWLADQEPQTRRFGEFEGREMKNPLAHLLEELPDGEIYGDKLKQSLQHQMRKDMEPKKTGEKGIYFTFTVTIGRRSFE
ncbi:hypothetical protein MGYG_02075 [Nannizzia gypsea CBS 118893]|uniref:Methyltransferase domain-containing protein n=1 Tax=Arthroderma gypseum (strain ATCC MYA-4604 / CBS 118893) TaxID=535722 RepID=E4UPM5_ARTGP|nr:hypothetical protein MGYG_02075 [Nannizzia gypsea CBS 118893]EFQ99062.1 hypothetical protein MGYG_02075 [Nannizzia gypsea CBS 118893]